jgi:hypothetical protein
MAEKFGQSTARPAYTPMEVGAVLTKADESSKPITAPYQEACGHVLWPAVISRPDVQFAVGILAQFTQNPTEAHWQALKRVVRYLYTTRDLWLILGGEKTGAYGFADADWASQPHRHSISGYAFVLGTGTISWSSKKQGLIALSTAEAEYVAAAHATKEVLWLRSFLQELDSLVAGPTILKCDNQSAIALCKDNKFHARTKHMDIRYHFVREAVEAGTITMEYVVSEENVADLLTKPLGRTRHEKLTEMMGIRAFV